MIKQDACDKTISWNLACFFFLGKKCNMVYFQNLFLEVLWKVLHYKMTNQGYLFLYSCENIFILFFTQYVHFIANLVIMTWIMTKNT